MNSDFPEEIFGLEFSAIIGDQEKPARKQKPDYKA